MPYMLPEMEATPLRSVVEVIEDKQPEIIETPPRRLSVKQPLPNIYLLLALRGCFFADPFY